MKIKNVAMLQRYSTATIERSQNEIIKNKTARLQDCKTARLYFLTTGIVLNKVIFLISE